MNMVSFLPAIQLKSKTAREKALVVERIMVTSERVEKVRK